jgi:hypothetical protein
MISSVSFPDVKYFITFDKRSAQLCVEGAVSNITPADSTWILTLAEQGGASSSYRVGRTETDPSRKGGGTQAQRMGIRTGD